MDINPIRPWIQKQDTLNNYYQVKLKKKHPRVIIYLAILLRVFPLLHFIIFATRTTFVTLRNIIFDNFYTLINLNFTICFFHIFQCYWVTGSKLSIISTRDAIMLIYTPPLACTTVVLTAYDESPSIWLYA